MNMLWEALALFISFGLWLPGFSDLYMAVRCTSDSRAALGAILKLSSPSREVATIVSWLFQMCLVVMICVGSMNVALTARTKEV